MLGYYKGLILDKHVYNENESEDARVAFLKEMLDLRVNSITL